MADFLSTVGTIFLITFVAWIVLESNRSSKFEYKPKSSNKSFYDNSGNFVGVNGTHNMKGERMK